MTDDNFSNSFNINSNKTVKESNLKIAHEQETIVEFNSKTPRNIRLSQKDFFAGKTLGDNHRYLLSTLLGKGGMSQVYKALDTKFEDRVVAIKLMNNCALNSNQNLVDNQYLIKRFMGEVKAISRLKHPNIIQIFDFGVTPDTEPFFGLPFYVMEYLPGQTLGNLLINNKILSLDSILNIVFQICAGLKEAHQKGIVHRDLKPDNIFLVHGGALGEIIKILDFGIAKNINSDNTNQTKLTQEGSFIGTYRYASPEQCRGSANIDQKTDIYSLGVILYETISGKSPYDLDNDFSNSQADWIACHIKVPPKPLNEQPGCENLPDQLVNIVMQCLAKSPNNRFSDIGLLQNNLANIFSKTTSLNNNSIINRQLESKQKKNSYQSKTRVEIPNNSSQKVKVISNKSSNDKVTVTDKSNKLSFALLSGVILLIMVTVGTIGYFGTYFLLKRPNKVSETDVKISQNSENNINLVIEKLAIKYEEKNYKACYKLAINLPNQDNFVIQDWIGKCGLAAAKAEAEVNSFSGAIAIAKTIPERVDNYQEIQDNINIWSSKILDYAIKIYREGKLEEAIKTTQIIPKNSNFYGTLPELRSKWQQEEEKHKTIIDNAQNLLNKGQWSAAKQEVLKIPNDFVFWRQEAQPILEIANQKINEIAEAQRRRRARPQRPRVKKQYPRVQRKQTQPLPTLKDRLKNTPLLDDDVLKERLQRN